MHARPLLHPPRSVSRLLYAQDAGGGCCVLQPRCCDAKAASSNPGATASPGGAPWLVGGFQHHGMYDFLICLQLWYGEWMTCEDSVFVDCASHGHED